jgi:hypothetical protein
MPTTCSPDKDTGKYTCYNHKNLKDIAKNYNKSNNKDLINTSLSKKKLWKAIKDLNFTECGDSEYCWLKQNYMKINDNINSFKENFRPEKPSEWNNNPHMWLNTYDILHVMNQYQDKYKNFKFMGVFPIDFAVKTKSISINTTNENTGNTENTGNSCISPIMCKLNLFELKLQKKNRLGIIFNLDKHNESGSHWVSMFVNFNPRHKDYGIYYYDSIGE